MPNYKKTKKEMSANKFYECIILTRITGLRLVWWMPFFTLDVADV